MYPIFSSSSSDRSFVLSAKSVIDFFKISEVIQPSFNDFSNEPFFSISSSRETPRSFATDVIESCNSCSSTSAELINCFQPLLKPSPKTLFLDSADALIIPPTASLILVYSSFASSKSPTTVSQVWVHPD